MAWHDVSWTELVTAGDRVKEDNTDNLDLSSSWVGGTVPTNVDTAVWDTTVTTANTVIMGSDAEWNKLRIAHPGGDVAINNNTLTLGAGGIDMSDAEVDLSIGSAVILGASQTWNVAGGRTLTSSGAVGGSSSLTKSGAGTLTLLGDNTFSGDVNFPYVNYAEFTDHGAIRVAHDNALGSGFKNVNLLSSSQAVNRIELIDNVSVSGVNIRTRGRSSTDNRHVFLSNISGNNTWSGNISIIDYGGGYAIESKSDTLTLAGSIQTDLEDPRTYQFMGDGVIDIAGEITDHNASVSVVKKGNGTMVLSNDNTYTGLTTINSGVFIVNGSISSGAGQVTVASGATLAGTGTVGGFVNVEQGATVSPGNSGPGKLTLANGLTLNSTSILNFHLGTQADTIAVTGDLVLDGELNITAGTGFGEGSYTIITYTGSLTNNTLVAGATPGGYCYEFEIDTEEKEVILHVYTPSVGGTLSGGDTPIYLGEETGNMILSDHTGDVVKWQRRVDGGGWSDIENTGTLYSDQPPSDGQWDYRVIVKNGTCGEDTSSIRTIVVNTLSSRGGKITIEAAETEPDTLTDTLVLTRRVLRNDQYTSSGYDGGEAGEWLRHSGTVRETMMRADLSDIPSDAKILSAKVKIHVTDINFPTISPTIYLYEQDKGEYDPEAEYSTYEPTAWSNQLAGKGIAWNDDVNQWYAFESENIRNLVQSWIKEGKNNEGFVLAGDVRWASGIITFSDAILVLEYEDSGAEGDSLDICYGASTSIMTLRDHVGDVLKWQKRVNEGTWLDIANTNITYSETPSSTGVWEYRAEVQYGETAPAFSKTAVITVTSDIDPPYSPVHGERCGTGTVGLSASVNEGETIDWYDSATGGSVIAGGEGTLTFTTPSISSTTTYFAETRNLATGCLSDTRTAVTATVHPLSDGGTLSGGRDFILVDESTGTLTLSGHTGEIVKWQKRVDEGSWTDIAHTDFTYSEIPSSEGIWDYRVEVKSGTCENDYSSIRTIAVTQLPVVAGSGSALDLNGTTDYVELPSGCMVAGDIFTLEFWVKPDNPAEFSRIFIQGENGCDSRQIMAVWYNSMISFVTEQGETAGYPQVTSGSIPDGVWSHVAWTSNGTTGSVYVNGAVSTGSDVTFYGIDGGNYIGSRGGSQNFFSGELDEVRLWSAARTQQDIQRDKYKPLTGNETGLQGYWRFDEPNGVTVYDVSPNRNHGTLVGSSDRVASEAWKYRTVKCEPLTHSAGYDPGGEAVTISQVSGPSQGSLSFDNAQRTVTFTPAETGVFTYTYRISDGTSHDDYTMSVTVESPVDGEVTGGTSPLELGFSTDGMTLSGHVGDIIKWQKRFNEGSWIDIANTSTTYSETPPLAGNWDYRAVLQSAVCGVAFSEYRRIEVYPGGSGECIDTAYTFASGQARMYYKPYSGTTDPPETYSVPPDSLITDTSPIEESNESRLLLSGQEDRVTYLRFVMDIHEDVNAIDSFQVLWEGNLTSTNSMDGKRVYIWNYKTSVWDSIGHGNSVGEDITLSKRIDTDISHYIQDSLNIMVTFLRSGGPCNILTNYFEWRIWGCEEGDVAYSLIWDSSEDEGIQPASGTWGTDDFWTPDNLDGTILIAWPEGPGSNATFAGSDGNWNITVSGTQNVDSITFLNSGYTLNNGTLNFNDSAVKISVLTDKSATIGSSLEGSSGMDKLGDGTLILTGTNTFTGASAITAGTLVVDGTTASGSAFTLNSGTTLAGSGTVGGPVTVENDAILSPGNKGTGKLTTGTLTLNSSSVLEFDLGATSDTIIAQGNVTLNGVLNITGIEGFGPGSYTLLKVNGSIDNQGLTVGSAPPGYEYSEVYVIGDEVRIDVLLSEAGLLPVTVRTDGAQCSVYTDSWTLIFDNNSGGGISFLNFEDGDNLAHTAKTLYYFDIDNTLSTSTGSWSIIDSTGFYAKIRQSGTINDLDYTVDYTVHGSGRMFIRTSFHNPTTGTVSSSVYRHGIARREGGNTVSSGHTDASLSHYVHLANNGAGELDLVLVTKDLWNTSYGAANSATGFIIDADKAGYVKSTSTNLEPDQKQVWEFMLCFGVEDWGNSKAVSMAALDYYSPDSLKFIAGTPLMEKSWEHYLRGHWTFDEHAGDSAFDNSGALRNGYVTGGSWVTGKWEGALDVALGEHVQLGDNAQLSGTSGGFTIMGWIEPSSAINTSSVIFGKHDGSSGYKLTGTQGGQLALVLDDAPPLSASRTIGTGTWRHVAASFNGSNEVKIYVDGRLDRIHTGAFNVSPTDVQAVIGNNYAGKLDDFRFYGERVSENTIKSIYQKGFSSGDGFYKIRADDNSTVHFYIDGSTTPRRYPFFHIANYWSDQLPAAVVLNGSPLIKDQDYFVHLRGRELFIGLNRVITGDFRLFVDNASGEGAYKVNPVPKMSWGTKGNNFYVKNFTGEYFGPAGSNQFYLYWNMSNSGGTASKDGEIFKFKSSELNPNTPISSSDNMIPVNASDGTMGYFDNHNVFPDGDFSRSCEHSASNATYTVLDSSEARVRLRINTRTISNDFSYDLTTIWTIYPTGQIFRYDTLTNLTETIEFEGMRWRTKNDNELTSYTVNSKYRGGVHGGSNVADFAVAMIGSADNSGPVQLFTGDPDTVLYQSGDGFSGIRFWGTDHRTSANQPYRYAWYLDIQHWNMSNAFIDSVCDGVQVINWGDADVFAGTRVTDSEGDINSNGFNEAEGAYILEADNNTVHFKLRSDDQVCRFNPVFRITQYRSSIKPQYVFIYDESDTLALLEGFQYNIFHDRNNNQLVIQLDTVLCNTVNIYLSSDVTLAVTIAGFYAQSGDRVNSLFWETESEQDNLGFYLYRRIQPEFMDSLADAVNQVYSDSLLDNAGRLYKENKIGTKDTSWVRVNRRIIPGAESGVSHGLREYSFDDRNVSNDVLYEYKLVSVDFADYRETVGNTEAMPKFQIPLKYYLGNNYPNPFRNTTFIRFELPVETKVSLNIYDLRGRLVKRLITPDQLYKPNFYRVLWDGTNDAGRLVAAGHYFYKLRTRDFVGTRRMIRF
ncbi:Fibronectin type III domain protein [Chitinispirillum alkaliphilum]|nr:Fibronectin type III domain protein [Chitinispirillum alkaliphilum]